MGMERQPRECLFRLPRRRRGAIRVIKKISPGRRLLGEDVRAKKEFTKQTRLPLPRCLRRVLAVTNGSLMGAVVAFIRREAGFAR